MTRNFHDGGRDVDGHPLILAFPHLALLYKILGDLSVINGNVKRTYKPYSVVIG